MPTATVQTPAPKPVVAERTSSGPALARNSAAAPRNRKVVVRPPIITLKDLREKKRSPAEEESAQPRKDPRKEIGLGEQPVQDQRARSVEVRSATPLTPVNRASQNAAAPETSPVVSTGSAGGSTPAKTGSGPLAPAGSAIPAATLPSVAGGGPKKPAAPASASLGRISSAPQSAEQAQAATQAKLISADCVRSEAQVAQLATQRRTQVSSYFSGARHGLSSFLTRAIVSVQTFIADKQAQITAAASRALAWVRSAILGTIQAAQALAVRIRARVNQMLESITTSVQATVTGITNQITGIIDSVPIPNLPGLGWIRGAAVGLLSRAAGAINGAFDLVLGLIRAAFNAGMSLLDLLLSGLTRLVEMALSLLSAAILGVIQMIAQALSSAVGLVGSLLRQAVLAIAFPILILIEASIIKLIGLAEQQALVLLRANRDQFLAALAESVTAPEIAQDSGPAGPCDKTAALQKLTSDAKENNLRIVQTFGSLLSVTLGSLIRMVAAAAARVIVAIGAVVAQVLQYIMNAITRAVQTLARVAEAIAAFVRDLIQDFMTKLESLVEDIRLLVQSGVDKLLQFARNGLSRLISFVANFVRNLVLGGSPSASTTDALGTFSSATKGPITKPRPGPITLPLPIYGFLILIAFVGYLVILAVPQLAVIIKILVALGLHPLVALAILGLVALALLMLLLYLLYRLLKSPTKPKPCPCTIETKTLLPAPDGTANTRKVVGVGERVQMTSPSPGTWSALHGTVAPTTGTTVVWTAPARAVITTVKVTPASGRPCLRLMNVKAPNNLTMIKKSEDTFPPGDAGAGMITDVTIHPRNVCLGATEWLEVPGPASSISGYFNQFPPADLDHHPNPNYVPFNDTNTGPTDHASLTGLPPPFGTGGEFEWKIPNKYKLDGESPATGRLFVETIQHFKLESTGKVIITKAGATVSRP